MVQLFIPSKSLRVDQAHYVTDFCPSLGAEFEKSHLFPQCYVCFSLFRKVKKKHFFFTFFRGSLLLMRNNDPYQNATKTLVLKWYAWHNIFFFYFFLETTTTYDKQ